MKSPNPRRRRSLSPRPVGPRILSRDTRSRRPALEPLEGRALMAAKLIATAIPAEFGGDVYPELSDMVEGADGNLWFDKFNLGPFDSDLAVDYGVRQE